MLVYSVVKAALPPGDPRGKLQGAVARGSRIVSETCAMAMSEAWITCWRSIQSVHSTLHYLRIIRDSLDNLERIICLKHSGVLKSERV